MRKRKEETEIGRRRKKPRSLLSFFRHQKATARKTTTSAEDSETPSAGEEKQGESGFFACYLLISLSPHHKGRTYIGFTVHPRRRIRQHNGEIGSGASRTRKGRPWEMVLCVYGFPDKVSALRFEWAWQHPKESCTVREAAERFKSLNGVANKIKLVHTMLTLDRWSSLNIVVNYFSTKYKQHSDGCNDLPKQMVVQVGCMDDLLCYTGLLQGLVPNEDDGDECDETSNHFDSVEVTFTAATKDASQDNIESSSSQPFLNLEEYEAGNLRDLSTGSPDYRQPLDSFLPRMTASPATSLSIEEIDSGGDWSITETECPSRMKFTIEIEDDEEPRPLRERLLIGSFKRSGQFEENRDAKTLAKRLPDATEATGHSGLWGERLSGDPSEKLNQYRGNRTSTLRGKQFTDAMEDYEISPPLRERLFTAAYGKIRQLVESGETQSGVPSAVLETDQIHSFGSRNSQKPTKSSTLTGLPPNGSAFVNLTGMQSSTGTAVTNEPLAPCKLRMCSNEKCMATEAAVDEEKWHSTIGADHAEIIDLLTPPQKTRYKSRITNTRVPMSSSNIIYLV